MNAQLASGPQKLKDFLSGKTGERVFVHPSRHPSEKTGFCPCDGVLPGLWFYLKATLLLILLKLPFNGMKIAYLRLLGATIGKHVFISVDTWIDPAFPQLLEIEDNVMIGVGVKIAMHEFGQDQFRAGRVTIRRGAIIGGFSIIGFGVDIGAGATVGGGAVVHRDVPSNTIAVGNPARIVKRKPEPMGVCHE